MYCHARGTKPGRPSSDLANRASSKLSSRIVTAGMVTVVGAMLATGAIAKAQVLEPGELDPQFGSSGFVTTNFGGAHDGVAALAVQQDGKIVAVGTGGPSNRFAIARYHPGGALDSSFGVGGKIIVPNSSGLGRGLHLLADGKILVAMGSKVLRLKADGAPDTSFGDGGEATIPEHIIVNVLTTMDDGRILVGGYGFVDSVWKWGVARFHATGALDTSFDGGMVLTSLGSGVDALNDLVILPDGKIFAAGSSAGPDQQPNLAFIRYRTNGHLDQSFGTGGVLVYPRMSAFGGEGINDLELLPSGKILACGGGAVVNSMLFRFNDDASFDTSFGTDGMVVVEMGTQNNSFSRMLIDQHRRIVTVGTAITSNVRHPTLARFDLEGVLDTNFGDGGKVIASFGTSYEGGASVALTSEGMIIMGGQVGTANVDTDFLVARYFAEPPDPNDLDGDGVMVWDDNCPDTFNPNQADFDGDLSGDVCDDDIDDDGFLNDMDVCDFTPAGAPVQPDGSLSADTDGDCDVDLIDFTNMQLEFTGSVSRRRSP